MDVSKRKKVYVIAGDEFTIEKIRDEISKEGYKFDFHFSGTIDVLSEADEVWVFGKVDYMRLDYRLSVEMGKDIWQMG